MWLAHWKRRERIQQPFAKVMGKTGDLVIQDILLSGSVADHPTILQQDDDDLLKGIPGFMTDFPDMSLLNAKQGGRNIASALVNFWNYTTFKICFLSDTSKVMQTAKNWPLN